MTQLTGQSSIRCERRPRATGSFFRRASIRRPENHVEPRFMKRRPTTLIGPAFWPERVYPYRQIERCVWRNSYAASHDYRIDRRGVDAPAQRGENRNCPAARSQCERRTHCGQRSFVSPRLLREGTWARPARSTTGRTGSETDAKSDIRACSTQSAPSPRVRRKQFFPLAVFSRPAGDTASHSRPVAGSRQPTKLTQASKLVAGAISALAKECGMPEGVFSIYLAADG